MNLVVLISLLLLFGIITFIKKQWLPRITYSLLSIVIGYYSYHKQIYDFNTFKHQINNQTFQVLGVVTDYTKNEGSLFRHRLTVKTISLKNETEQINSKKDIYVYTQKYPKAYIDNLILTSDIKFHFSNDHHFQDFLIKNQIAATIFTPILSFKKINKPSKISITRYKRALLKKINAKMTANTKLMFNSIFLGNRSGNKADLNLLKNEFQTWGIIHYLARSGLHLVIISSIWQTMCSILQIPIIISNIIILCFMLIFYLLTWSALPFVRALIMIICYRICHFFELQIHLLHILNISCILTLLHNPISIFCLDFQLSFLLTYGLVFFNEIAYLKKPV